LIPHRRGEDGYFLMLLTPPGGDGAWSRETVRDGDPLDLLILADTSGSMGESARENQAAFVAALLGSLAPTDRVNLATCDVDCQWVFDRAQPVEDANVETIRDFLTARESLGWTDLDEAFASALKKSGPKTQVIYVGDGVYNTRDADPVAAAKRLTRLCADSEAAFHAISVGSSFESIVMNTIASLGGGSNREISGERTPQKVALELLSEITSPTIRDLEVTFDGVRAARVYPERLPNLAAGSQQILIGRYLPQGDDQQGTVTVTGTRDGKPIKFTTKISLKDAEFGNSFIPRLWARMHLSTLLEQGSSQQIKDEIIALSEEYHIITPYTSLLVLESDEDRERFKVKRRFQMRDGEKFFAEGRDQVDFELMQQQMRLAGNWRLGLRRQVLRDLMRLGRQGDLVSQVVSVYGSDVNGRINLVGGNSGALAPGDIVDIGTSRTWNRRLRKDMLFTDGYAIAYPDAAEWSGLELRRGKFKSLELSSNSDIDYLWSEGGEDSSEGLDFDGDDLGYDMPEDEATKVLDDFEPMPGEPDKPSVELAATESLSYSFERESSRRWHAPAPVTRQPTSLGLGTAGYFFRGESSVGGGDRAYGVSTGRTVRGYHDVSWLSNRFPHLSEAPTAPAKPEKPWPADVREVVDRLLRTKQVNALEGGLMIDGTGDSFDVRFDRLSGRGRTISLLSKDAWLTQTDGAGAHRVVNFCDGERRGVFSLDFLLGRVRDAQPTDLSIPGVGMSGYTLRPLEESYPTYDAKLVQARSARERAENDRTVLVLSRADRKGFAVHVLIDTERNVILSIEQRQDDKATSSQRFSDFVELADAWWPTRVESFNGDNKRTSLTTYELKTLDEKAFGKEMKTRLAALDRTQFLTLPSPTIKDAKQAVADDKATFDDRFAMMTHFAAIQDWERVTEELAAAEKFAEGKPGMQWVRVAVQIQSRKRDQARQWAMEMSEKLAKSPEQSYFLATSLYNQADNILESNERLRLLETLAPVFTAQPAHIQRQLFLPQNLISCCQQTGRVDKVIELRRQLAEDYPHNQYVQQQYANELANRGDYEAAYAWLDEVIVPERRWLDHEEDSLRATYTGLLRREGRYDDLVEYLAAWVKQNPPTYTPYHQYLSALVKNDQEDAANKLIAKWLSEGRIAGKLELPLLYRQQAAIYQAMGQGFELHTNRIEHRWHMPLAQTAKFFLDHESAFNVSNQIMGNWRFQQLDACRDVRRHAYRIIEKEIDTLPVDRLNMLLNWVWPNDPAIEQQQWRDLARRLEKRWGAEKDPEAKQQLAGLLIRINSGRLTAEENLAFLKKQMNEGPTKYRVGYVNQYFNALLGQPWRQQYEDEAFRLLSSISDSERPAERLAAQIAALHRVTDSMLENRYQQLMGQVEHPEKLTRTELRDKQTENRTKSREAFAKKLAEAKRAALKDEERLHAWLDAERLYLAILLKQDLDRVADECWEVVGAKPPKPLAITDEGELPKTLTVIDRLLMARHTTMLMNLAVRRDADPKLAERLLAYFDAGIEQAGDKDSVAAGWKLRKYSLLIALDRPKELEAALQAWIRPEVADNHWRRSLAQIVAEQGRIKESIALFEKIEADDQLAPNDYRTLANWYMVVDEKQKHESALIGSFMAMEEWRMSNWLSNKLNPWRRSDGPLPEELDKDVPRVFAALFKKSSSPQNYTWYLREFYRNSRDFRLLASVADAVVGHTPGKIYPFLSSMESLFSEVREEATADSIVAYLATVRKKAQTTVDHRALDLLELLIERRSSEVLNQPGSHVAKALAAMRRAFDREWTDGEPRLMADLLANLGRISQEPLAKEQVRELEELHKMVDDGSIDRLHIGHGLARTYWSYSRHNDAIDQLTVSLTEFENANDGVLPNSANDAISTLISYLESRGHFARGEQFLLTQLKHPVHTQQIYWLKQRLHQLYENAISRDAEVSLGRGAELYKALEQILFNEIKTDDHNHRYQLVNRLCSVYRTAHNKKIASASADLTAFAFDRLPEILGRQTSNYQSIVSNVANTLRDINGPREGLRLLIVQIESEPKWFRLNHQDGWSQHSYQLGYWRSQVGDKLGDLDPRLLKIVLDELRRDLMSQQSRNRNMYDRHHSSYYWGDKEKDFHRVAEEVYEKTKDSGHAVTYVAHYLWWGINRQDRAIEILFTAHNAKILDEAGQDQLVDFLHRRGRYAESIPVLLPLVETRPDNMQYRTRLMHAYFRTDQPDKLLALLKATDEYFHAEGRWNEGAISALAHSCLSNQLYQRSVDYFLEAIDLHKRTHARQGIGNGTLSSYYWSMSQAYSGLEKTPQAVEAACAAIVSWGPRHDQRRDAISNLERVLRDAPDLPAYIKHLEKQVEETGLHNPIVRKALGKVFFERGKYDEAIPQLKLAVELQPNDTESHQKLVACYDKTDRPREAIAQLLDSIRLSRRNIDLYRDLGSRYEKLKEDMQAERAYTSIVEALPNESEGHALMARIRQTQDRWQDSIEHLRQVAEIRALEPTGLVELAKAQIHLKLWDDANETCQRLRARTWPSRFSNIESQIRDLERRIEIGRK
jgi:tetratricopeptide (TPR) repeat protein